MFDKPHWLDCRLGNCKSECTHSFALFEIEDHPIPKLIAEERSDELPADSFGLTAPLWTGLAELAPASGPLVPVGPVPAERAELLELVPAVLQKSSWPDLKSRLRHCHLTLGAKHSGGLVALMRLAAQSDFVSWLCSERFGFRAPQSD